MPHRSVKKHSKKRSSSRKSSRKSSSKKSHKKRKLPSTLKLWGKLAREHGFMVKGDFKRLPKKGSSAYDSLKKEYVSEKKRLGL